MASGPITAWQIEGERVVVVTDFLFLGSKITADGDRSHEIRRQLLLGRTAMTNLDRVLKSRDSTLQTKVCIVKPTVFAVVMFGCEKWNIKKAECQRIDAFTLWCWRRLLKSPLDNKEIKAVNLKGDHPWIFTGSDAEAETPVFWSSDANRQLIGKVPDAGKDQGWKEKRVSEDEIAGWHHQCSTPGLPVSHYLLELPEFIFIALVAKNWTQLGDWTTTTTIKYALLIFFFIMV